MKGGEGRKKVLTWLQEQKRAKQLPEVSRKYADLPDGIREAIAKAAGVDNVLLKSLTATQRRAMRNEAEKLYRRLDAKTRTAQRAFMLLVTACEA